MAVKYGMYCQDGTVSDLDLNGTLIVKFGCILCLVAIKCRLFFLIYFILVELIDLFFKTHIVTNIFI